MRFSTSLFIASLPILVVAGCQRHDEPLHILQAKEDTEGARIAFISPEISQGCSSIEIEGSIAAGDSRNLAKLISLNEEGCSDQEIKPGVSLNSLGGDLDESIALGRLIREKEMMTIVMPDANCVSACAVAFLGGVSRTVHGAYGIHRPYAIDSSLSSSNALDQYNYLIDTLKAYMLEMRISPDLAEQMVKTSPEDVRFLTRSEMSSLGVIGRDPVWEDLLITRSAAKYRISRQEYISRRAAIKSLCGEGLRPYPDPCSESVLQTGRALGR